MTDKETLLKRKAAARTAVVQLDGGDVAVTVRALTKGEVVDASERSKEKGAPARENFMISYGLLDPEMTPDEVAEWLDGAPSGDAVAVMNAISELSGHFEGAQKSGVSGVRGRKRK